MARHERDRYGDAELAGTNGGNSSSGLHGVLGRPDGLPEFAHRCVEVITLECEPPHCRRSVVHDAVDTHELEDHITKPEEVLASRVTANWEGSRSAKVEAGSDEGVARSLDRRGHDDEVIESANPIAMLLRRRVRCFDWADRHAVDVVLEAADIGATDAGRQRWIEDHHGRPDQDGASGHSESGSLPRTRFVADEECAELVGAVDGCDHSWMVPRPRVRGHGSCCIVS